MSAPTWRQESCASEGWLGLAQRAESAAGDGTCFPSSLRARGPAWPPAPAARCGRPDTLSHHLPCSWVQIQLLPRVTQRRGRPRPREALRAGKTAHLPASPPASSGLLCPSVRLSVNGSSRGGQLEDSLPSLSPRRSAPLCINRARQGGQDGLWRGRGVLLPWVMMSREVLLVKGCSSWEGALGPQGE